VEFAAHKIFEKGWVKAASEAPSTIKLREEDNRRGKNQPYQKKDKREQSKEKKDPE